MPSPSNTLQTTMTNVESKSEIALKWRARWIAPSGVETRTNCYFHARQTLMLETQPGTAILHIAAESFYQLWVNGQWLAAGPARGNRTRNFYDSIEVAGALRPGENTIALWVHCINADNTLSAPAQPGLLVQLDDGRRLASDAGWQVRLADEWREDTMRWSPKFGFTEWRDYRREPPGWLNGTDHALWAPATVLAEADALAGKLILPRDVPLLDTRYFRPTRIFKTSLVPEADTDLLDIGTLLHAEAHLPFERLEPRWTELLSAGGSLVVEPPGDGRGVTVIVDFEHEISGGFELELSAPAGAVVDVAYDDAPEGDRMKVNHHGGGHSYAARFITRGGRQTVADARRQMGYRFFQVTLRNFSEAITIHHLQGVDIRYPYVHRGAFRCDDPLLNRIWDACVETLSACSNDTYIDCPWRERTLWTNDVIVTGLTTLQAFGDPRIGERCLRLALSGRRAGGLVTGAEPVHDEKYVLPATCIYIVLQLRQQWLYTGNLALVAECLPAILEGYQAIASWEDSDGLVVPPKRFWNFIEWSYDSFLGGMGQNCKLNGLNTAPLNWFYAWGLRALAELLGLVGREDEARVFADKVKPLSHAIERKFRVPGKEYYADWVDSDGKQSVLASQLNQALAIMSGALPVERQVELGNDSLFKPSLHEPELFMSHFQFMATELAGDSSKALERIRRLWGPIVHSGSTTIWENAIYEPGRKFAGGSGSLCHAFATAPVSFFQRSILGVRPLKPGFEEFTLNPEPMGLKNAAGRVPTPAGEIEVAWTRDGEKEELEIELKVPQGLAGFCGGKRMGSGMHAIRINGKRVENQKKNGVLN